MRNKLTDELAICGMNAVLAAAEYNPLNINRLFVREDRFYSFTELCKQLAERKRPYKMCEDGELERICKTVHHQGVVAMIKEPVIEPLSAEDLEQWAAEKKTGIILHSIGNDHNLGAIARAAAFFDVTYLVLNEKDPIFITDVPPPATTETSPDTETPPVPAIPVTRLTTSAYRVAEGGMEHLTIRKVSNTAHFLRDASKKIITIGTDIRARMRVNDLKGIIKDPRGIALVLGNEETGLPVNVKDNCSYLLRIPGTGYIDSLNVSQASAIFLHAIFDL